MFFEYCAVLTWRCCRLVKDAELFDARLNKIAGFEDIGKSLVEQIKAKTIRDIANNSSAEKAGEVQKDEKKK